MNPGLGLLEIIYALYQFSVYYFCERYINKVFSLHLLRHTVNLSNRDNDNATFQAFYICNYNLINISYRMLLRQLVISKLLGR